MAGATLDAKGWYLTSEGIELCIGENGNKKEDKIVETAKDTDLKEIGRKWLPEDVNKGSCEYVNGPGVLQIQKIRNIAVPKDNEDSQGGPRLLKFTLTDGHLTCIGVEIEKLDKFGLDVPPGSKVLLKGTTAVEHGILLLTNKNCQLIGGRVQKLAENWELKKMLSKQSKQRGMTEGGPPPFVPFGHRIQENKGSYQKDNFKSLAVKKEEKKEEGEFEQQRQATIAEALQAKDEKAKTFGGGKQIGSDKDVARLMEMGFSAEQASGALKQNNGNFQLAVNHLLQGKGGARNFSGGDRDRQAPSSGRDYQGRQPREDRRENRGRRQKDDDTEEVTSKPSANVTLFDFLTQSKKLPVESGKENKENKDFKSSTSVPSKSMQHSNDGSRQNDKNYKPQNQDGSAKYDREDSQNDKRNFDSRPKSSPANNSHKSNYDNKGQRPESSYDRSKPQQNYNDRGQGRRPQQNNNDRNHRNERYQNQDDRNFNDKRQNESTYKTQRNDQKQNYDKRPENDRQSNYSDRNSQNDRRSNVNNYDRQQGYEKKSDGDQRQNNSSRNSQYDSLRSDQDSNESRNFQNKNPGESSSGRPEQRDRNNRPQYDQSQDSYKGKSQNTSVFPLAKSNDNKSKEKNANFPVSGPPQFQNPGRIWNRGEHCLAKYWEDNQYYHAVISQLTDHTAVVLFQEYGNYEEVALKDLKPLNEVPLPDFSVPPPGMFPYNVPPPPNQPTTNQIQTMEFRRKKTDSDKPTLQYYQPPKQRYT